MILSSDKQDGPKGEVHKNIVKKSGQAQLHIQRVGSYEAAGRWVRHVMVVFIQAAGRKLVPTCRACDEPCTHGTLAGKPVHSMAR